jgi:hypothetical protein
MDTLPAQNPDVRSRVFAAAGWRTLVVLAGVALALRAADAIPGWFSGVPRGVHLCTSVQEAEARTGLRLDNAAFAGRTAGSIRTTASPVPAVAVVMQGGDDGSQLTFYRSRGGSIPTSLRSPQPSFHEIAVPLRPGLSASLKAQRQADGSVWQDLEWSEGEITTGVRWNGRTVELLRLARQLVEGAP